VPEGEHSDPPGAVSNQNQEEAQDGLRDQDKRPNPERKDESKERGAWHDDDSPGSSTEGSQATGHPDNAG
jgi:hypothetical protein